MEDSIKQPGQIPPHVRRQKINNNCKNNKIKKIDQWPAGSIIPRP